MAGINDEKLKLMEDEMNRFEAEIALPVLPPPPPPPAVAPRPVIGSNTYTQVQRRLEEQQTVPPPPPITDFPPCPPMGFPPMMQPNVGTFPGVPPPPPPPPPMLIPHQVQRGPPLRHPVMRPPVMVPPGPPMLGGPPPPPPRFMGPPAMSVPGPPFMGPGPPPMPVERLPAPVVAPQPPVPAIVSATPKLYVSKPELPPEEIERKNKKQKAIEKSSMESPNGLTATEMSKARDMAEKVKASTVQTVTVGPTTTEDTNSTPNLRKEKKKKKVVRMAGGQIWEDNSLLEWEDDDFRIFCGDLGNDVTDEILTRAFSKYQSFLKAKVVRDKRSNKTKGFGFVSFKDPQDFIKAMKEMNGRYVGSRPIKLRKSTWKSRNIDSVRKKEKEKAALTALLTGR